MAPVQNRGEPKTGRLFPCDKCGAALVYTPGADVLSCPYCGYVKEIAKSAETVKELPFEAFLQQGQVAESVLAIVEGEQRCTGCGAIVMMTAATATDECPFCGTHLDNPITTPAPLIMPAGVLPFLVTDAKAKEAFNNWVKSRWFAPSAFRKSSQLGRVAGLYVPYWTYDSMTWSHYRGQRGDYYYVTVGSGKEQRTERRTRWTSVSGRVDHFFDDVLVCASRSVPGELINNLEPWDLGAIKPFCDDYLSGFRTERYQVGLSDGFAMARGTMDATIRVLAKNDIGGDTQIVDEVSTQVGNITFKHILMPVWITAYRFRDKSFRVLVNARTGEVSGERPWSAVKITLAVIAALIVIIPIIIALEQSRRN